MIRNYSEFPGLKILIVLALVGLMSCEAGTSNDHRDLVTLSEGWWGTPIDEFAKRAGLAHGEYSQGDHPVRQGVKVIVPISKKIAGKWEPQELPPLAFEFTSENGLEEINGFCCSRGKQAEIVEILTRRYGKYSTTSKTLDLVTYVWVFDKTVLEIHPFLFRIFPRSRSVFAR